MKSLFKVLIFCGLCLTLSAYADQQKSNVAQESKIVLVLLPAKFSNPEYTQRVASECSMLQDVVSSIKSSAKKYSLNIEYRETDESAPADANLLKIEFDDVQSHKWGAKASPGSVVTVRATISKGGQVQQFYSKRIGSGVSFGACGRLEKIATKSGVEIAKWASENGYKNSKK